MKNIKRIIIFIFLLLCLNTKICAEENKAIVFIINSLDIELIQKSNAKNLNKLIDEGAIGLINVKDNSIDGNMRSRYLSINTGVRADISSPAFPFMAEEIKKDPNLLEIAGQINNEGIIELNSNIKREFEANNPNDEFGKLGDILKENGIKIGVLGNNDRDDYFNRDFILMAIDSQGKIPYGYLAEDLQLENKYGYMTNYEKLLDEFKNINSKADLTIIDLEDLTRIKSKNYISSLIEPEELKLEILNDIDNFIGEVIKEIPKDSLIMALTMEASEDQTKLRNRNLTPIIVKGLGEGIVKSNSVRRDGVVSNFDILGTITEYFNIKADAKISVVENKDPLDTIYELEKDTVYIRNNRTYYHIYFIVAVLFTLALSLARFFKLELVTDKLLLEMINFVLMIPLGLSILPIIGYINPVIDLIMISLLLITWLFIYKKLFNNNENLLITILLTNGLIIIIDGLLGLNVLINSPLGSDLIAGGRFFGLGNDYMGIITSSIMIAIMLLYNKFKKREIIYGAVAIFLIMIYTLSPFKGANMGGSLTAFGALVLTLITFSKREINYRTILLVLIGVVIFVLALALVDSVINSQSTHGGQALEDVSNQGIAKIVEILNSKLRQVFYNLINNNWNKVLYSQLLAMFIIRKWGYFKSNNAFLDKGYISVLLMGLLAFLFNDTGTIAFSIILAFLNLVRMSLFIEEKI